MTLTHTRARLGFPTMTEVDFRDLQRACRKVYDLMRDGCWHRATEIIMASGQREGLRRMRELRQLEFRVEERRTADDSREWEYRLAVIEPMQGELF